MKQKVNDELKKHFRPEFLNRIDDIVVFHQLTTEQLPDGGALPSQMGHR